MGQRFELEAQFGLSANVHLYSSVYSIILFHNMLSRALGVLGHSTHGEIGASNARMEGVNARLLFSICGSIIMAGCAILSVFHCHNSLPDL